MVPAPALHPVMTLEMLDDCCLNCNELSRRYSYKTKVAKKFCSRFVSCDFIVDQVVILSF